jgi:hypothetical protein
MVLAKRTNQAAAAVAASVDLVQFGAGTLAWLIALVALCGSSRTPPISAASVIRVCTGFALASTVGLSALANKRGA